MTTSPRSSRPSPDSWRWVYGLWVVIAGLAVVLVCYILAVGLVGRGNVAGMFSGVTGVVGSVVGAYFGVQVSHSARRDAERSRQDAESKALRLAAAAPPEVAEKALADPPPAPR